MFEELEWPLDIVEHILDQLRYSDLTRDTWLEFLPILRHRRKRQLLMDLVFNTEIISIPQSVLMVLQGSDYQMIKELIQSGISNFDFSVFDLMSKEQLKYIIEDAIKMQNGEIVRYILGLPQAATGLSFLIPCLIYDNELFCCLLEHCEEQLCQSIKLLSLRRGIIDTSETSEILPIVNNWDIISKHISSIFTILTLPRLTCDLCKALGRLSYDNRDLQHELINRRIDDMPALIRNSKDTDVAKLILNGEFISDYRNLSIAALYCDAGVLKQYLDICNDDIIMKTYYMLTGDIHCRFPVENLGMIYDALDEPRPRIDLYSYVQRQNASATLFALQRGVRLTVWVHTYHVDDDFYNRILDINIWIYMYKSTLYNGHSVILRIIEKLRTPEMWSQIDNEIEDGGGNQDDTAAPQTYRMVVLSILDKRDNLDIKIAKAILPFIPADYEWTENRIRKHPIFIDFAM